MRRTIVTAILVIATAATSAEAGQKWRLGFTNKPAYVGAYNKQAAIGAYGRAVYPKYTWGFHARELQNVGVPHGDIGSLGSGIQRDPW